MITIILVSTDSITLDEVEKEKPQPEVIKKHAAGVHENIKKAESEHHEVMKKTGIKDSEEPVSK
ncbi:hypothetical protein PITCH_A920020 [uncultured Desulfobacterium sp.]|uniref:Uncharacterized protein n=1 Tax=uncultured Desulfobacterium sp. TaxID=201089 RepID=A0A445N3V1_9BACT|nr:hypothetical protein PITCH_A920020 [uncultured Desulfobacterium sp.]